MGHINFDAQPELRQPVLIGGFRGWNDAAEAATTCIRVLVDKWSAKPLATIDPEEFFDFTQARPIVRLAPGMQRELEWPSNEFFYHAGVDPAPDVILLLGTEPHLKWRTFTGEIVELAKRFGVRLVITLGALLAEAVHTRPVPITGYTTDTQVAPRLQQLGIFPTRYEGPTGIVGTLHDACRRAGLPTASVWAAVPHYLGATPNPRASLAMLRALSTLLDLKLDLTDLASIAISFEQNVSEAVRQNEGLAAYVNELERRIDEASGEGKEPEFPPTSAIIHDLEEFLRNQRSGDRPGES